MRVEARRALIVDSAIGVALAVAGVRLYQMLRLVEQVKTASRSDLSIEWLSRS